MPFYMHVLLLASFVGILIWFLLGTKFEIEPGKRERLVIQNVLTGTMAVLHPGTHYYPVWWKELQRVDLNREPIKVPKDATEQPDETESAEGVEFAVSHREDALAGRPYYETEADAQAHGKHMGALVADNPDDENHVRDDIIIAAVTRIDFPKRVERIKQIVSSAIDRVIGSIPAKTLTDPGANPFPFQGENLNSKAVLLRVLAEVVQRETDADLTFTGINIVGFKFIDISPKDPAIQAAVAKTFRASQLTKAAAQLMNSPQNQQSASPLTFREALAAGEPDYGTVTLAESGRDAAGRIADGLRNFGRGMTQLPQPNPNPPPVNPPTPQTP